MIGASSKIFTMFIVTSIVKLCSHEELENRNGRDFRQDMGPAIHSGSVVNKVINKAQGPTIVSYGRNI